VPPKREREKETNGRGQNRTTFHRKKKYGKGKEGKVAAVLKDDATRKRKKVETAKNCVIMNVDHK